MVRTLLFSYQGCRFNLSSGSWGPTGHMARLEKKSLFLKKKKERKGSMTCEERAKCDLL